MFKVGRFCSGGYSFEIDENALLINGIEITNVVLEWVGHKAVLNPDPRFALMVEPVPYSAVEDSIVVLVMAELNVTAQIPGESLGVDHARSQPSWLGLFFNNREVSEAQFEKPICGAKSRWSCTENDDFSLVSAHGMARANPADQFIRGVVGCSRLAGPP